MAETLLLGLFEEPAAVANALDGLRQLGLPEDSFTVVSSIPYRPAMLGRHHPRHRLALLSVAGALLGAFTALLLVGGSALLYPIAQGGQPLIPIPPTLIVTFELTMLGLMWATFFGVLFLNRYPTFGRPMVSPRLSDGQIGVVVEADKSQAERAERLMVDQGALAVERAEGRTQEEARSWLLWAFTALLILGVAGVAGGLFAYDIIRIPFPTNMANQPSIQYETGPRLAEPAGAVPVQGPAVIGNQPASLPVPASAGSLQRGQVLFNLHCALCHGETGKGDGRLSGFFNPKPADLTGSVARGFSDDQLFMVITAGFGVMPSLREDLTPAERRDVINWVRQLK